MQFLVDEKINENASSFNFMDVGIHENVELVEVKVETSPNGNNFMAFTFRSGDGKELTKTEWQPINDKETLAKKAKNQATRIKHIMTKYLPEEQTKIEYDTDNWSKYASTVKAKLDPVMKGVKVRIKAVYDNNDYVSLPNYLPFIERMDADEKKLSILSIDKLKKDDSPDRESNVQSLVDQLNGSNNSEKDELTQSNSQELVDNTKPADPNALPF